MTDPFRLGEWVVQPRLNQVSRDGRVSHLRPRVMDLLVFLADHAGQVVSKDDLLEHVWGAKFVAESSLTTALTELRQALEDDARRPWLVETISKRGYRLIVWPDHIDDPQPAPADRAPRRSPWWLVPAAVATLMLVAAVLLLKPKRAAVTPPRRSVVIVVPLRNGSGDVSQDYLAESASAAILEALWRIQAVRIVSAPSEERAASLLHDGSAKDAAVLSGLVRRIGDRVFVDVSLNDASNRTLLWSTRDSRPLGDLTATYDAIGNAIARELNTSIDAAVPEGPVDPAAYEEYVRGRYAELRRTAGGCPKAIEHLTRATKMAPAFASPWIELGYCYVHSTGAGTAPELRPQAEASLATALRLNPQSGAAHALRAIIEYRLDYDWRSAAEDFATAYRLEPRNAQVLVAYGEFQYLSRQGDGGLRLLKQALDLNPFAPDFNFVYGQALYMNGRYSESAAQFRQMVHDSPDHRGARYWLPEAEARLGQTVAAGQDLIAWVKDAAQPSVVNEIGPWESDCRSGDWSACERMQIALMDMEALHDGAAFKQPNPQAEPFYRARKYADTGQSVRALELLEEAYRKRYYLMPSIDKDQAFESLRGQPRFGELLRAIGLPR